MADFYFLAPSTERVCEPVNFRTESRMRPIKKPDTENTDPKYWDKVLTSHGLSMERGKPPLIRMPDGRRLRMILYVGGIQELDSLMEEMAGRNGRVTPEGHGPDE